MQIFGVEISTKVFEFFRENLNDNDLYSTNKLLNTKSGIVSFFNSQNDIYDLIRQIENMQSSEPEPDRTEYGDFQTPLNLCDRTCKLLQDKQIKPKIIIEPTCGKGGFILSVLNHFPTVEKIYGIEIYRQYVWETKFSILNYFLNNEEAVKPEIIIFHEDIFDFNFKNITNENIEKELLIIGNPPWVTNSKLSSINSSNIPKKTNFKKHRGIDAITGKGNFDIAENIALIILNNFSNLNGNFAFLQKSSVTKNIVFSQSINKFNIAEIEKYNFDAQKEFNVATDASLFYCKLKQKSGETCKEYDLYEPTNLKYELGWFKDKFISNHTLYSELHEFDGVCQLVWRQGIKHDCSKVMELKKLNGHYINQENEKIELEDELIYGILKSSDLKTGIISKARKFTIVTQTKPGQNTDYIEKRFPKTYQYLNSKIVFFVNRKSSIYDNKPNFSIFGVGDYSFKKYKVAISGFYKSTNFALVLPGDEKAIQLDDTCYFIGFDTIDFAVFSYIVLNHKITQDFLTSIIFFDSKRPITKEILMRIDLLKIANNIPFTSIYDFYLKNLNELQIDINENNWKGYKKFLKIGTNNSGFDLFTNIEMTNACNIL